MSRKKRTPRRVKVAAWIVGMGLAHPALPQSGSDGISYPTMQEQFLKGTLGIDLAACRSGGQLPADQEALIRTQLEQSLRPLLNTSPDPQTRLHIAAHRRGEALLAGTPEESVMLAGWMKELAAATPERIISILNETRGKIMLTAQMRQARAMMAEVKVGNTGKLEITLKSMVGEGDALKVVAPAVLLAFEDGRRLGLDCSAAPLNRLMASSISTPIAMDLVHKDLKALDQTVLKLIDASTFRIAQESTGQTPSGTGGLEPVIEVIRETSGLYARARKVLQQTIQLHASYVPSSALDVAMAAPTNHGVATSVKTEPSTPSIKVENAAIGLASTPQPTLGAASNPVETSASKLESTTVVKIESSSSTVQPPSAATLTEETAIASVKSSNAAKFRSDIVNDVARQTAALRGPRAAEPLAVANNLLARLKRISQIAEMLVADSNESNQHECRMGNGQVSVIYEKDKSTGGLAKMAVTVDEKYQDQVVMSWSIHLDRQDDSNFRIASDFNHIKSAIQVEESMLLEYPNYHQLMVLMNRLSARIE